MLFYHFFFYFIWYVSICRYLWAHMGLVDSVHDILWHTSRNTLSKHFSRLHTLHTNDTLFVLHCLSIVFFCPYLLFLPFLHLCPPVLFVYLYIQVPPIHPCCPEYPRKRFLKGTQKALVLTEMDSVPTAMETEHVITTTKPNKRKLYDYPTPSTEPGLQKLF